MLESSLEFLKCVNCGSKLELTSFRQDKEIIEGILECLKCSGQYPFIPWNLNLNPRATLHYDVDLIVGKK